MDTTAANIGLSRDDLARAIAASRLLPDADLDRLLAAHPAADAIALGHVFVSTGALTDYQLDALCRGRHAALRVGNYDILDKLGAGGMGTVYKARHRRMKRVVALKVLSAAACQDEAFVQRFQREVETIARLVHPNVVTAYDADEADIGHYLAMEFVDGRDLTAHVRKSHPLPVGEAVGCVVQAARGLACAHAHGVVHRDIKPANLLRDEAGVVKVTDLGLARLNAADDAAPGSATALTAAGGVLGTADYMAPEQAIDSAATDGRADIYSLGATLHFLLTGAPPFVGKNIMAVLLKHREAAVPCLRAARPDVPESLNAVFRRMMAKAPADRFPTMEAVIAALEAVAEGGLPETAPVVAPAPIVRSGSSVSVGRAHEGTIFDGPDGPALSVLLVEPSRVQAGIVRRYLEGQDITVTATVPCGEEAVASVRANRPGVVLAAFHLPDMTGIDLARRVRQEMPRNAPGFVLLSGDVERDGAESLSQLNRVVVLAKPFTPEQLVQTLNAVTGKSITVKAPGSSFAGLSGVRSRSSLPAPKPAVDRSTLRVLIVDDSPTARANERAVLRGLGFTHFTEAADGAQAAAAAATDRFDLIVTDYHMPLMDGHALVSYLKQTPATANTPVVMVTTATDAATLDPVRQAGVTAIFGKAFPAAEVKPLLDRLFGG